MRHEKVLHYFDRPRGSEDTHHRPRLDVSRGACRRDRYLRIPLGNVLGNRPGARSNPRDVVKICRKALETSAPATWGNPVAVLLYASPVSPPYPDIATNMKAKAEIDNGEFIILCQRTSVSICAKRSGQQKLPGMSTKNPAAARLPAGGCCAGHP